MILSNGGADQFTHFSAGNTATNGVIQQTVAVTPGGEADFSFDFGKIGSGSDIARVRVNVTYVDENGIEQTLYTDVFTDNEGGGIGQTSLDRPVSATFTIPEGVTEVTIAFYDTSPATQSVDLAIDNVSLDVTCFCTGTLIATPTGDVPIEDLRVGDLVMTADHGPQKIRWIGSSETLAKGKLAPVRICAAALGNGLPRRDLLVSRQHRMLVRSRIARNMFLAEEVLISAIKLTELPGILVDESLGAVTYFHMLFDSHEIVLAEGAESESLHTGPVAMAAIPDAARQEIYHLFPELADAEFEREFARLVPEGKMQKSLIRRHIKNSVHIQAASAL
ncbi:Hint domain-containing protein [Paracoccus litorisediminis]|uniref:Hint domain-containing protein n=1 Tax=Paracoccus litorisediminis TaxID=2006130 RepID=UPI003733C254